MVALLLILALMAARPAAARADAVPDADGGRGVPGPRGDLLVLKLAPAAAARAWGAVPGRGQAAWLRATGVAGLERAAAALGGAWFEPEFRGDAPRRGETLNELATFWLAHLPEGSDAGRAQAMFAAQPEVVSVTASAVCAVSAVPDDPYWAGAYYFYQASRRDIHAVEAWDVTTGDSSVVVAVIDTGVIPYHPDLGDGGHGSQIWTNAAELAGAPGLDDDGNGYVDDVHGWDFVNLPNSAGVMSGEDWRDVDNDPNDFAGHGTAVAGVIGAHSDNGIGVTSTAWRVRLMPLRVGWSTTLYPLGLVDMSYVAQAVRYATRMGASVINCSFESTYQSDLNAALDQAMAAGVTIVTAAGNKNTPNHYIGDRQEALAVTSTDQNDKIPLFANTGGYVDVAAPGVNVITTTVAPHMAGADSLGQRQPAYALTANGSSFSAAMASGVVALYQARRRALGLKPALPFEAQARLIDTADDISAANPDITGYGSGRINALRVLTDPPTSSVIAQDAMVAGPGVPLAGTKPCCAAVAMMDSTIALVDVGRSEIYRKIPLSGTPVGGIAAASLGGGLGFGMFVATADGSIAGYDQNGKTLDGWPVAATTGNTPGSMPALGDLDGDGALEVLWGGSDGRVWAWHHDGAPVTGFPKPVGPPGANLKLALGDIDGQPGVEVVAVTGAGIISVMHGNGEVMPGWPQDLQIDAEPPTLTRFTQGAEPTILFVGGNQVYTFTPDGLTRWRYAYEASYANSEAVPGDLNGDGNIDVITSRTGGGSQLSVLTSRGQLAPFGAWPRRSAVAPSGTPLMGHLTASGDASVLWTLPSSGVYAYAADGSTLPGYPKPGRATWDASIYDFDGDGRTEILGGPAGTKGLYVYKLLPGTWHDTKQAWPTPRGNFARTGCSYYDAGIVGQTPVLISLVTATAEPGVVRLAWRSGGDRFSAATLERRVDGGQWLPLATLAPDGLGNLRYEDRDVETGAHLAYRLAVTAGGVTAHFGEVELDVPRAARLELGGASPNPAALELRVRFGLASAAPARLELLDLAGRRCAASEVGSLGPGNHVLAMPAAHLAPGIYVLRLMQSGSERRARCAVVR